jgi:hypothetical protein
MEDCKMLKYRKIYGVLLTLFLSIFISYDVYAQTYLPVGPQTNVPVDTVTGGGWTECYRDTYNIEMDASTVLASCPGERLMLSCRTTGSDTLTLLAQGDRSDVTFDTGDNADVLHIANSVGWYFNTPGTDSWGFVRAGDSVDKRNCDVDTSGANDERLCWHLLPGGAGGYRCGATEELNDSADFERIVYASSGRPIPTLSQWGMIAAAAGLGLVGVFYALKRRKAQTSI